MSRPRQSLPARLWTLVTVGAATALVAVASVIADLVGGDR